jgi:hypothetical protein
MGSFQEGEKKIEGQRPAYAGPLRKGGEKGLTCGYSIAPIPAYVRKRAVKVK